MRLTAILVLSTLVVGACGIVESRARQDALRSEMDTFDFPFPAPQYGAQFDGLAGTDLDGNEVDTAVSRRYAIESDDRLAIADQMVDWLASAGWTLNYTQCNGSPRDAVWLYASKPIDDWYAQLRVSFGEAEGRSLISLRSTAPPAGETNLPLRYDDGEICWR